MQSLKDENTPLELAVHQALTADVYSRLLTESLATSVQNPRSCQKPLPLFVELCYCYLFRRIFFSDRCGYPPSFGDLQQIF
jgi:hypothetical protein